MSKQEAIRILKLLSALESWSFAEGKRTPDFLYEQLSAAMAILEREILK